MKKLLTILVLLISTNLFSQNLVEKTFKTVSNTGDTIALKATQAVNTVDTGSLYRTIYSDAKEGLKGLAAALKVGVEHVYTVLVKQQVVNSVTNIVIYIILLLLCYLLYTQFKSKWFIEDYKEKYGLNMSSTLFTIFSVGFYIFTGIMVVDSLQQTVTGICNPEYLVIKEIMTWVK